MSAAQAAVDRTVEGRVRTPGGRAPAPVPGIWVVLHRVGADRAAPLDSMRSDAGGRYRFRYVRSGLPDAIYFVSTVYRGIAYFSAPLAAAAVRGGDADLMVYDTTSSVATLRVQGRHVVVSAPRGGRREVAEVFEIENDGARTVVPRDSAHPLWATRFPAAAESLAVRPGDLGAGAVSFRSGRGEVFAPISPGVRQLVVTYRLPNDAFPLTLPLEAPAAVVEVLLEELLATVDGPGLVETDAATIDGRTYRRFLARDLAAAGALRVKPPAPTRRNQAVIRALSITLAAALAVAFAAWFTRRRRVGPASPVLAPGDVLIAQLAALDARFERRPAASDAERARYERDRAALKARIARALEGEAPRT